MSHPIQPQNLIDRAIEAVAPAWAASRYAARAQIEVARGIPEASYRGAVATRSSRSWGSSISYRGGSSKDRRDTRSMCDRARDIYDQNVIGGGLLDTETDNVVSDGFSLQMLSGDEAFNAEAEDRFYTWLDKADVQGMATGSDLFRMSWMEPRKDGDGGFLLLNRGGYPMLQYLPKDLIVNPRQKFNHLEWKDGVRVDPAGRPIGFNVRDVDENGRDDDAYIDARDFVYLVPKRKPLSVRGATVYARIFRELDQLDAYPDAVTKAAIMAAIFGLIERRKNPSAAVAGLGTLTNSQGDQQKAVTLENGMLKVIGTDESVFQVQAQQPMQQAPEWVRTMMRLACLAFDMPIEIGQKDLSQVNFSGGRIGLIGYYRSCRVKQDWLKSRCWNRIVFWWLSMERKRQALGFDDGFKTPFPADYGRFELHGREWDYNDPKTEAEADLVEMDMGILSEQQACERRGRDWKKTQALIGQARQVKADLQIPIMHSTSTRDETAKVTAVDANGNPLDATQAPPLNGAQITAAIRDPDGDVVGGDVENTAPADATTETGGSRNASPAPKDEPAPDGSDDEDADGAEAGTAGKESPAQGE
jgi:capsid protein